MIEVTALKKKFKLTKDHKKNKIDEVDPREDKDFFHSVKNVSFSCAKGEVLGLLGPNGAGKTTTLRMISTALKPDDGSITIAGNDIIKKPLIGRKSIGFFVWIYRFIWPFNGKRKYRIFCKASWHEQASNQGTL
jgi:sodium transport system ATP-binding protein